MESGYEINGHFFPAVDSFNLGDPILIRELTGLDFPAFAEEQEKLASAVEAGDDVTVDPIVMVGLIGVSVWHANPDWSRSKVVRWVQSTPLESIKFVGEEAPESPPAEAPADTASGGTPAALSSSAGESASPNGSGDLTSRIGAALA